MKTFKKVRFAHRGRLRGLHLIKGNVYDIVFEYKKQVRVQADASQTPVIPADSNMTFSENGFFVYRNTAQQVWVCPVSEQEHALITAIITAKDGKLDGKEALTYYYVECPAV